MFLYACRPLEKVFKTEGFVMRRNIQFLVMTFFANLLGDGNKFIDFGVCDMFVGRSVTRFTLHVSIPVEFRHIRKTTILAPCENVARNALFIRLLFIIDEGLKGSRVLGRLPVVRLFWMTLRSRTTLPAEIPSVGGRSRFIR